MAMLMQSTNLGHSYGGNRIFENISFELQDGDRVALIGENGAGKSTFFSILARQLTPHNGVVTCKRNLLVGFLTQEIQIAPEQTLREVVGAAGEELRTLEEHMRSLEARMASAKEAGTMKALLEDYDACQTRFELLDGYGQEARVAAVLAGLGIAEERWDRPVGMLSGGEKKIAGLARLLVERPEVLLLDEPDNHLDFTSKAWLEEYIAAHHGAVAIISHDRYMLDRVVNRIFELEDGTIYEYQGTYSQYLVAKQTRLLRQKQIYEVRQREMKQIKRSAEQLTMWARQNDKFASRAQNRWRMLAAKQTELAATPMPMLNRRRIRVDLEAQRGAAKVLEIQGLGKSFGAQELLRPFELVIGHGERVGLVGANGSGKTTLFRLILGQEPPTCGVLRLGPTIRVGYYAQEHETLDLRTTPIAAVRAIKPMTEEKALSFLHGLLFDRDDCYNIVGKLSGGERSRLQIALLILGGANLLLLDEPTNNLDIPSSEELETALLAFEGTLVTISHDRYFLDKVADRIIELEHGMVYDYPGGFTYYEQHRGRGTALTTRTPISRRKG